MRKIIIFGILFLSISFSFSTTNVIDENLQSIYQILIYSGEYGEKKIAVFQLKDYYEQEKYEPIIDKVIDLLYYNYNYDNFKEDNNQMYNDDLIAGYLIDILKLSKEPRSFEVLLLIVSRRNHTDFTILKAWDAIKEIDWNKLE